ncbi:MAG: hypothetical protein ACRDX8_01545 [Acidimicrobiales bacterium]
MGVEGGTNPLSRCKAGAEVVGKAAGDGARYGRAFAPGAAPGSPGDLVGASAGACKEASAAAGASGSWSDCLSGWTMIPTEALTGRTIRFLRRCASGPPGTRGPPGVSGLLGATPRAALLGSRLASVAFDGGIREEAFKACRGRGSSTSSATPSCWLSLLTCLATRGIAPCSG